MPKTINIPFESVDRRYSSWKQPQRPWTQVNSGYPPHMMSQYQNLAQPYKQYQSNVSFYNNQSYVKSPMSDDSNRYYSIKSRSSMNPKSGQIVPVNASYLKQTMSPTPVLPLKPLPPIPDDRTKKKKNKYALYGSILLVSSLTIFSMYDPFVDIIFHFTMQIKDGNLIMPFWKDIPVALNTRFFLFEIKNGNEFLNGAPPLLVEHGPYTYKEYRTREVIKWTENSVSFIERFRFRFDPENSKSLETRMQVINYPIMVAMLVSKHIMNRFFINFLSPVVHNIMSIALRASGEKLIEVRSAAELLEGRKVKLIALLEYFLEPLRSAGIPVPEFTLGNYRLNNHSFGFVIQRVDNEFGPFEHYTRTEDGHLVNEVFKVRGKSVFDNYKPPCNRIHGSDGMFFGTRLNAPYITFYNQHLCRTINLYKNRTHHFKGIKVVRYTINERMYDVRLAENQCYCFGKSLADCDGWTDISGCTDGLPMGLSLPHFYASPRRQKEVRGLKPDASKHIGYIDIEPNLGVPINALVGMQCNIAVQSFAVPSLSSIPKTVLPMFWVSEKAGVESFFTVLALMGSLSLNYGSYGVLLSGLSCSMYLFYKAYRQRPTPTSGKKNLYT